MITKTKTLKISGVMVAPAAYLKKRIACTTPDSDVGPKHLQTNLE
jgi:hypothetical protein